MRFLIFVSFVSGLLVGCSPQKASVDYDKSDQYFWTPQLRDNTQKNDYRITISTDNFNISGIWVVGFMDNSWRGTMINEFGLKIFDFICTANKCELLNVTAFADKRHIRKTIADDLQFILKIDNSDYKKSLRTHKNLNNDTLTISRKNKILQRFPNGEMTMYNKKRNLTYTFKKI